MKTPRHPARASRRGFTLVEVMVSCLLSGLLVIGVTGITLLNFSVNATVTAKDNNTRTAGEVMGRILYGYKGNRGLREAKLTETTVTAVGTGWRLTYAPSKYLQYYPADKQIRNHANQIYASRVESSYAVLDNAARSVRLGLQIAHPGRKGRTITDSVESHIALRN